MKAEEAKQRDNRTTVWLESIYKRIEAAAGKGKRIIQNPFTGVRMLPPTADEKALIFHQLEADGYKIILPQGTTNPLSITIEW